MNDDLVSKKSYTLAKLKSLSERRSDQSSFHIFSEGHMRGQVFNLQKGQEFSDASYEGTLLITGLKGTVRVNVNSDSIVIEELDQLLINPKSQFSLMAETDSTFQFVWSPPFEKIAYGEEDL